MGIGPGSLADLLEEAALRARHSMLSFEQRLFEVQTAAETDQFAGAADHTVAGQNDRKRIASVCGSHCPCCSWSADPVGELPVRHGLAVRNLREGVPDAELERSAFGCERQIEVS